MLQAERIQQMKSLCNYVGKNAQNNVCATPTCNMGVGFCKWVLACLCVFMSVCLCVVSGCWRVCVFLCLCVVSGCWRVCVFLCLCVCVW